MNTDLDALRKSSVFAEEALVVDVQSLLHTIMEEKGISRSQLAEIMGVSKSRITQIFSSECKNFTVRLLARAFYALGEQAEITCSMKKNMQVREILFKDVESRRSSSKRSIWSGGFSGPVNDNGCFDIESPDASDVQVSSSEMLTSGLFVSAHKAFERRQAA